MCKRLFLLISFLSVLALVGSASAALPEGWQSQDIGTTDGSADESDGMWIISADGADIWGSADEFHYAYVPLSGDGTIVAHVVDNGTGSNAWAKGGVMIRQSLEAGSTHAIMAVTGSEGGGGAFQWRPAADGDSISAHDTAAGIAPGYWVKLERVGNAISGSYSPDGVEWTQQGDAQTIEMTGPVLIGLFVTSHAAGELRTYLFDNVDLVIAAPAAVLPEGWQSQDIGTTGGSAAESDGTWIITADGADVWNASDEFHYAYVPLSGDGTIVARVVDNGTGSNAWAKGGVMIRETLDADSKHTIMALTGGEGGGITFQSRPVTGERSNSMHGDITAEPPYWVKLTREGNTITAYSSADGVDWALFTDTATDGDITNPTDVEMADPVLIGLFVTSHASGELRTYLFDNVSIELPRKMDNWEGAVAADAPGFLATNVPDALYDIGAFSGDITYEFCVKSNPDETEASMCLIGRRQYGDTQAGLKFDQWNDTGEYGATLFGVVDLYYGVPYSAGVDTHLVFVSSEDAGTTALYENGVYKGSVDGAITLFGLVGIGYGAEGEDASGAFDDFDGDIFGVAIYDSALSDEQIAAHSDAFLGRVVKINFQQAGGDVPAGYLPDYGEAFGDRGNGYSYGWSRDIQPDARDRDIDPDQRYDTLIHLQKAENAIWEIALPNGAYNLFIVGGDPGYTDQTNDFDVEGVVVVDPTPQGDNFDEYNVTVVVSDGLLTIQPGGAAANAKITFVDITALVDVTAPGDLVQGVPNDGDWPPNETPDLAVDDNTATKYLHFKGETETTGFQVTPAAGPSIVTGLTFTTANDAVERDPIAFELSGSNEGIDGPYELIASGDIVDFAQADACPRFTMNSTPISFDNDVIYAHYQVLFPAVRDPGSANSMQIAEVELLGVRAFPPAGPIVHYKLDDGEGVIAVDSSNGLDGILMGDPQWAIGIIGGALDFDGDGDYVDCGTNATLNGLSDAITVSAWVSIRSVTTTWMGIVMKGETAWRLGVNGDTTGIHWAFTGGDRGWQAANSVTELPLDEWHHIAGTYDRSVGATNYVDGVAEAVNPDPDGVRTNEMPLLLGENPEALGRLFDGLLDDVRIYDRALSADELNELIALGAPANILANGGFEDGVADPWSTYGDATLEVVQELAGAAVPEAPIEGGSCLHVVVGSAGANFWDAGLQHAGHVFEAGKSYTLSAFLKAKEGTMNINFKPELGADPWTGYGSQEFTMTDTWAEYTVNTGVIDDNVDPATITFHIAYAPGEFWVDDVRFTED